MKKTLTIHIDSREHTQLNNALAVAVERFAENEKTFKQVAAAGGSGFISADGARAMAKDFAMQAGATRMLLNFFSEMVEPITIKAESDDEDEDDDEGNPFHPESPEGRAWEMERQTTKVKACR